MMIMAKTIACCSVMDIYLYIYIYAALLHPVQCPPTLKLPG